MSRARRVSHNHGVELPSTVKESCEIDKKNGNVFWRDAIEKEMHAIRIVFEILEDDKFVPKNYKREKGNALFDVKMDVTRNSRRA